MLESEITAPHVMRGQMMLFRQSDALAALAQLEQAGAVILGADQFRLLDEDGIQPTDTIDVSPADYNGEPYSSVRDFIKRVPSSPAIAYELVWD